MDALALVARASSDHLKRHLSIARGNRSWGAATSSSVMRATCAGLPSFGAASVVVTGLESASDYIDLAIASVQAGYVIVLMLFVHLGPTPVEDGGAVQGNNDACARPSPTEPCLASRGEGRVAEREWDVGGGVFLSPVSDGVGGGVA